MVQLNIKTCSTVPSNNNGVHKPHNTNAPKNITKDKVLIVCCVIVTPCYLIQTKVIGFEMP